MLGYYYTEVGTQNMIVHMWAYDDLNQRERCREALFADPEWNSYRPKIHPLMRHMETRIMKCAPFFVERLKRMLEADKKGALCGTWPTQSAITRGAGRGILRSSIAAVRSAIPRSTRSSTVRRPP
jgi:hypothetical protein